MLPKQRRLLGRKWQFQAYFFIPIATVIAIMTLSGSIRPDDPIMELLWQEEDVSAFASGQWNLSSTDPGYKSLEELRNRPQRFPSVDERVLLYMGTWYNPPCETIHYDWIVTNATVLHPGQDVVVGIVRELPQVEINDRSHMLEIRRTFATTQDVQIARTFFLSPEGMEACEGQIAQAYCRDVQDYLLPAALQQETMVPLLGFFGDEPTTAGFTHYQLWPDYRRVRPRLPIFKKFRMAIREDLQEFLNDIRSRTCRNYRDELHEIVILLTSKRHFEALPDVPGNDIPWSRKRNQAVYRGALTGATNEYYVHRIMKDGSPYEMCELMHRCRLVLRSHHSSLVDAGLTGGASRARSRYLHNQTTVKGIPLYKPSLSMREMLEYKAIVVLEGNDVATGLKWALYSNSVVLAPRFAKSSWLMEDRLIPWVHYIPLDDDLANVHEQMEWILRHNAQAEAIAQAGQLWIKDLLYHPDSESDTRAIYDEIVRRYARHFELEEGMEWPNSTHKCVGCA